MLAHGVYFDRDRIHSDLWVWVLERLMRARGLPSGVHNSAVEGLRHLPALLALYTVSLAAVATKRDDVMLRALREPAWRGPFSGQEEKPAMNVLHIYRVLESQVLNSFPRWESRWIYPESHFLRESLEPVLGPLVGDGSAYEALFDRTEYRIALAHSLEDGSSASFRAPTGNFMGDYQWDGQTLRSETEFRKNADISQWGWGTDMHGESDELTAKLAELRDHLSQAQRWG